MATLGYLYDHHHQRRLAGRPALPTWFEPLGSAISIGFLTLIGWVNQRAVMQAPTGHPEPVGGLCAIPPI